MATINSRLIPLPLRASLTKELLDACPRTSGYTKRRATIQHFLDLYTRAMDNAERTNAAKFMMETRRAFGLN